MNQIELRVCWYRIGTLKWVGSKHVYEYGEPKRGNFHQWAQDYEELRDGVGTYPVALVEDHATGRIECVRPENICFGNTPVFDRDCEAN